MLKDKRARVIIGLIVSLIILWAILPQYRDLVFLGVLGLAVVSALTLVAYASRRLLGGSRASNNRSYGTNSPDGGEVTRPGSVYIDYEGDEGGSDAGSDQGRS